MTFSKSLRVEKSPLKNITFKPLRKSITASLVRRRSTETIPSPKPYSNSSIYQFLLSVILYGLFIWRWGPQVGEVTRLCMQSVISS